ncbi:MAG: aminotransferase class III-fold pyridoxal phosphate-dependent enzyme, partial [Halieaceae bacterium]|nr:aminotransferase class III-fold pyridoxal phosphate-dependent enzyme [Halieaceae bacterium]
GEGARTQFISRDRSYHGNTLGALSVSGFSQRRKQYEGRLSPCSFVSSANPYRLPGGISEAELSDFLANELEREILRLGPDKVAGFIFEPVVGAAGGVVPAPPHYATKVRSICDQYGVLLIADEVMCGSGRCGTWRALEHDAVMPDIMAIAKGLAGGYVPLGATLYSEKLGGPIDSIGGGPNTGHTFSGHTLACAAGAAVQTIMVRDQLVARVKELGEVFRADLHSAVGELDAVGDIRGRGFFVGVELVQDRETRQPFDPELRLSDRIRARALEAGLICYPVDGTLDGHRGNAAILAPPYNASESELEEIIDKFDRSLRQTLSDIKQG